ncbi:MAG: tetratricopeptide repeat protein [Prochlorothrix sp.]|nr:tetratricopeptide repeat protein [Prochlorothrix sp.]
MPQSDLAAATVDSSLDLSPDASTPPLSPTEQLFNEAIERYQQGEDADSLVPVFKEICDRAPKSSPAWTCLAWLYLLSGKGDAAYRAAKKAVKLNPQDPQARVNLAIAMLESGQKGVRDQIELVQQLMELEEVRQEVVDNLSDGLQRKPDWKSLLRVKQWLLD